MLNDQQLKYFDLVTEVSEVAVESEEYSNKPDSGRKSMHLKHHYFRTNWGDKNGGIGKEIVI